MRKFLGLLALVFVAICAWQVGNSLSSDAISMAVGVLFGVLAGLPAALLVLSGERRRSRREGGWDAGGERRHTTQAVERQPPVIVVSGPGYHPHALPQGGARPQHQGYPGYGVDAGYAHAAWPTSRPQREFTVVGEEEPE